ncbi:MAG TPA: nitroreductase family protein [bacterium]|nr:nitroreductase family protein [bacterium]
MDCFEALLGRRSIRKYEKRDVPEEVIQDILKAAMAAPSAGNQQPWHFVVIRDRGLLDAIPEVHPHAVMVREAPAAIAVCADLNLEKHAGYWVQDLSAATQNLLVAAHAKGLGAVWLGVYPRQPREQALGRLLRLPETVRTLSLVVLGHPAEHKRPADRYDSGRVHWDGW